MLNLQTNCQGIFHKPKLNRPTKNTSDAQSQILGPYNQNDLYESVVF